MSEFIRQIKVRVLIRRTEWILISSVLLLSGAVMPSSWEPPLHYLPAPVVDVPPEHPWIALTFDDGPHPGRTQELLAILRQEHVPATFFVVGKMVDRYPRLARAIAREGHELANHTYTHPDLARLTDDKVLDELAQTRQAIQRLTGQDTNLFRPPGGDFSRRILRAANRAGYRMVLWSVQTNDVSGASYAAMHRRIRLGAEDGAIILMHSGVRRTIDVLPSIIADLREKGFHFVTISTLLGHSRPTGRALDMELQQTVSTKKY